MIALVDTNVLLDVMLGRQPFLADSVAVLAAVETGKCHALLCASTVTTLHYIARRHIGTDPSLKWISKLLLFFEVASVNRAVIQASLVSGFGDFEDAILHEAALQSGANCIVTRNVGDFRQAQIPVYTPGQFLGVLP